MAEKKVWKELFQGESGKILAAPAPGRKGYILRFETVSGRPTRDKRKHRRIMREFNDSSANDEA